MDQTRILNTPLVYPELLAKSEQLGFDMAADKHLGVLLKTLVASKPAGNFLELGTGLGLSSAWMLEGMDKDSTLISIDNNREFIQIAKDFFGKEKRIDLVCADGGEWLSTNKGKAFDLIFADAWPGKYSHLEEALNLLKIGGLYVIDDMKPQPNWPKDHEKHVEALIGVLETSRDITITKMDWSTGIIVAAKTK